MIFGNLSICGYKWSLFFCSFAWSRRWFGIPEFNSFWSNFITFRKSDVQFKNSMHPLWLITSANFSDHRQNINGIHGLEMKISAFKNLFPKLFGFTRLNRNSFETKQKIEIVSFDLSTHIDWNTFILKDESIPDSRLIGFLW